MSGMNELYKAYDDALELASKFEENFVELGRRLRLLQDNNQNLFKGVCAKTGLDLRKAYYLASMARQIGFPISSSSPSAAPRRRRSECTSRRRTGRS